eukprot:Gregarina_sp_Poly_1__4235@NODE_230_length_11113_cov_80_669654_g54_i1_p2_GENE_NODE_230_length_11113_cov_80_669654_g54_i1NODE_230_length_11113_cov_80_669654_g54_i1_p2_ORF_typecomplete_len664_score75_66_NODE_230_length_11113_cov_80_669654_g54_i14172408
MSTSSALNKSKSEAPQEHPIAPRTGNWTPSINEPRQKFRQSESGCKQYHPEHKHVVRVLDCWTGNPENPPHPVFEAATFKRNSAPTQVAKPPTVNWEGLLSLGNEAKPRQVPIGQQRFGGSPFEMDATSHKQYQSLSKRTPPNPNQTPSPTGRASVLSTAGSTQSSNQRETRTREPPELIDIDERIALRVSQDQTEIESGDDVEVLLTHKQSSTVELSPTRKEDGEIEDGGRGADSTFVDSHAGSGKDIALNSHSSPAPPPAKFCLSGLQGNQEPVITSIDSDDDDDVEEAVVALTDSKVQISTAPQVVKSDADCTTENEAQDQSLPADTINPTPDLETASDSKTVSNMELYLPGSSLLGGDATPTETNKDASPSDSCIVEGVLEGEGPRVLNLRLPSTEFVSDGVPCSMESSEMHSAAEMLIDKQSVGSERSQARADFDTSPARVLGTTETLIPSSKKRKHFVVEQFEVTSILSPTKRPVQKLECVESSFNKEYPNTQISVVEKAAPAENAPVTKDQEVQTEAPTQPSIRMHSPHSFPVQYSYPPPASSTVRGISLNSSPAIPPEHTQFPIWTNDPVAENPFHHGLGPCSCATSTGLYIFGMRSPYSCGSHPSCRRCHSCSHWEPPTICMWRGCSSCCCWECRVPTKACHCRHSNKRRRRHH